MKKLIPISAVLLLGLWIGCGDDKGTDSQTPPEEVVRVIANTTVSEPDLDTADEQVWASVDCFWVGVSQEESPKLKPPKAAAIPDSICVQAIKKADNLYLRLQWSDPTFDAYPDHFEVDSIFTEGLLPVVNFTNQLIPVAHEDQIYVMFDSLPDGSYDVWNWRVLTTDGAHLGKGCTYRDQDQQPTPDAVGTAGDSVAIVNPAAEGQPAYAHKNTSDFDGHILDVDSAVHRDDSLYSIYDTLTEKWYTVHFYETTGWDSGQIVPGWLINRNFASLNDDQRGSRWDIRAVSVYDSTALEPPEYRVVLCRELNTGFIDDIDLSTMDSVKVNILIYDNEEDIIAGGLTDLGFSDDFWIILNMPD